MLSEPHLETSNAGASAAERFASLDPAVRADFLAALDPDEADALISSWRGFLARPAQIAPDGDWDIWMILSGRGFGKTRSGAEWIREQVLAGVQRVALIAETQKDLEEVMIEGASGILNVFKKGEILKYTKKPVQIKFAGGAIALGYNATQPDQLRGPNFDCAWLDELAKFRHARETWDMLQFGLRLGTHPRALITTTPRPISLIKAIIAGTEGQVAVTTGSTLDNRSNLAPRFLERIVERYDGTRLGRQELDGEILGDIPNSIWQLDNIDAFRVKKVPKNLARIVVAVDPAITNTEESNEHGIIVAGMSADSAEGYILDDGSRSGSPADWAAEAVALFDKWEADAIVVEVNQGGDMVTSTLRSIRTNLPIREVRATRGKHVRAEPISALYQRGRIHHVGSFVELENQMCLMTNEGYEGSGSPDRVDAMVWALTELFPRMTRRIVPVDYDNILHLPTNYPMARRSKHHA